MKLMMTEKKDQAAKIAAVMGYKEGKKCFDGVFEGEPIKVVWASGHLVTLKTPSEVIPGLPWDDPSKLLPIPQQFPMKVVDPTPNSHPNSHAITYLNHIKSHINSGISEFIISTDSDREGEAIGWYIINYLGYKGPVRRAWLSAGLDPKSIKESMANLRDPSKTKSWYRAAETRGRSDWAFMFLVRAYTHYASYGKFGPNLGQGSGRERVMSVGRVQTSCLAMIVRRDIEIQKFISRDHFKVSGLFSSGEGQNGLMAAYTPVYTQETIDKNIAGVFWEPSKKAVSEDEEAPLDSPLFVNKIQVDEFKKRLLTCSNPSVRSYTEGLRTENPPKTYSLTTAQADIVKNLNISAGLAQTILEDLYEQGWTSYARTGNQELPMNFYEPEERNGMLNSLMQIPSVSAQAKEAMAIHNGQHSTYKKFVPNTFTNKGMEHYGIVPTHQVMTSSAFAALSPNKKDDNGKINHTKEMMQAVYELVAKQYVQALYPPAKYATQEAEFVVPVTDLLDNKESIFRAKGERLTDAAWRAAFNNKAEKNNSFPKVKNGDSVRLAQVEVKSAKTTPPSRYTEVTLTSAMENVGKNVPDPALRKRLKDSKGIGTPATRKTIVSTLIARGYITVKGGVYYSSVKGRDLISSVPAWLSTPETTALWEDYLYNICEQKDDSVAVQMRNQFVTKQINSIENLIKEMMSSFTISESEKVQSSSSVVTKRMQEVMKNIAENKKITLPRGALKDPKIAEAFLKEHLGERKEGKKTNDGVPSDAQINYAKSIVEKLKAEGITHKVPDDLTTNIKSCSEFIDKYKDKAVKKEEVRPPSVGQIEFAKKLIAKLPEGKKAPKDVLTSSSVCSRFIKEQTKDWKR